MNVSTDDITALKKGEIKAFLCDDEKKCRSASSLITNALRVCKDKMQPGVANYERKIQYDDHIIIIRAMGENDVPVLNP